MATYSAVLCDIGASLAASGFRRVFFLNGHGGNESPMREALDRIVFERALDIHVPASSYWTCAADALTSFAPAVGPIPGHASCMLALHPDLVRLDQRLAPEPELKPLARSDLPGTHVRRAGMWEASDGRTDDVRRPGPWTARTSFETPPLSDVTRTAATSWVTTPRCTR